MPADDLPLLIDAAREAGEIAMRWFARGARSWDKDGGAGPVTEADLEIDRMLHERLLGARPGYAWLSEEIADEGLRRAARLDADRIFIVDPIDGTRAFIKGDTGWGHALAIAEDGVVTAGVMHLPAQGVLYAAARGRGATRDGRPIRCSDRVEEKGAAALVTQAGMRPGRWPGGAPPVEPHFRPALAHRLCLVAEGRFDASISVGGVWEWDAAAGGLIAQEAGATVSDAVGRPLAHNMRTPRHQGLLAAPPGLHAALLARLAPRD